MTLLALLMLSLPSAEVLKPVPPSEVTRRPIAGTALVEVLALRGRGGRWLERDGRLVPPTPEGAAELQPPSTQEEAERLVTLFESGTVIDRARAARLVPTLPALVKGPGLVERCLARTTNTGGAELVHLVIRFEKNKAASRVEKRLLQVEGSVSTAAPARQNAEPSDALAKFWAAVNAQ